MSNKLSLYELDQNLSDRFDLIEITNGEVTPEEAQELTELMESHRSKSLAVSYFIKKRDAEIETAENQVKALSKVIGTEKNRTKYLKSLLTKVLDEKYSGCIEEGLYKLKTAKVPASVLITDEEKISDAYKIKKTTFTISKTMIKEDLKNGVKVAGACLVDDKRRLMIKG